MRAIAITALACALAAVGAGAAPRAIPIGLQLYSVRDDCARDLPGVLKAVAQMGYQGVEFAGYYGRTADELRQMLDANNLKCCGTHIGLDSLLGDEFAKTVAFNKTLGNAFLVVPGLSAERTRDRAAWTNTARIFSEIAAKLRPLGMYVGYHNHGMEFTPIDGAMPWDLFFGNADRRVVMQFDTGNALSVGVDSIPYIRKYPGRALTVHIKEHSATNDKALIGEGDVRWNELLSLLRKSGGTRWFIVEQESYAYPPLECADRSLRAFKSLLKSVR